MLTESQKRLVEKHIEKLIRESMMENGFFEKKSRPKHYNDENDVNDGSNESSNKRSAVMKWLASAQELHSVLSYDLWPDMDKDTARSLFSKKYRGHDADGKKYSFDDSEINTLYNMRTTFIKRAGLNK